MEPLRGEDPRQVGRYRLVARLGAGGMGQVFLGFSPTGRPVAVKMVHPELARDSAFLRRFRQETAAARKVSGAYTASVVDAGEGDRPWLATSLVAGPSLADAVEQRGPLPEVSVWRLAAGLAEALDEVHRSGLIHRDLKPSNVLLATDGPRVIDFGISRALEGTSYTGTGMVVGTPSFMSPEQASGTPVGPASDVFSFGGVVAFAATGTGPFGEGTPVAMIYRVVHAQPMVTGLPGALNGLVTRCLAKRPEDRPGLAELMDIITANVEPATSATSFWPAALTEFITSYQASFTADAQAWSPPAPRQAEPVSPPPQAESPSPQEPTVPPGSAGLPGTAREGTTEGHQEAPGTITVSRDGPSRPPASVPAAYTPPPTSPPAPWPPAPQPARRPRRRAMIAGIGAAAAAIVAVVVVLATSLSSGTTPPPLSRASTRASISGSFSSGSAVAPSPLPALVGVYSGPGYGFNGPNSIAADSRHVWVLNGGNDSVTELDARTGARVQTLSAARYGFKATFNDTAGIIDDGTDVWVGNENSVTEISAGDGSLVRTLQVPASVNLYGWFTALARAGTQVWAATPDTCRPYCVSASDTGFFASFVEFDASDGSFVRAVTTNTTQAPIALASDGTHVWVVGSDLHGSGTAGTVTELNASDGRELWSVSATIYYSPQATTYDSIAYADGLLWVANGESVTEFNAANGKLIRVLSGTQYQFNGPSVIVAAGAHVFVVNATGNSVTEIDSRTGALVHTLSAARYHFDNPTGIAVVGNRAWVLNSSSGSSGSVVELAL